VAEVGAINPVCTYPVSLEGNRFSFLRVHDEVDVVGRNRTAMGQIFDFVMVGQRQRDFIAFLYLDDRHAVVRRLRHQAHMNLVALAFNACILRLDRAWEIIHVVNLAGLDQIATYDDAVVRLRIGSMVLWADATK